MGSGLRSKLIQAFASSNRRAAHTDTDPIDNTHTDTVGYTCITARKISTRAFVQTGDNVVIGGFIVKGLNPRE